MSAYDLPPVHDEARLMAGSAQILTDHKRHTVWVFPPKCAQTSLRMWVGEDNVVHNSAFVGARNLIKTHAYRVVMSVRHPEARLISAWRNKFDHLSLGTLVQDAVAHTDHILDIHLRSQCYLLDMIGIERPHRYIRVEHLAHDTNFIPWVDGPVGHENTTGSKATDFETLPLDLQTLFRHRYARDYALWEDAQQAYADF